jgi:hypothetical protein
MATIARRGISAATKADEKLRQHGFCILRDVEPGSRIEEIDPSIRVLPPRLSARADSTALGQNASVAC